MIQYSIFIFSRKPSRLDFESKEDRDYYFDNYIDSKHKDALLDKDGKKFRIEARAIKIRSKAANRKVYIESSCSSKVKRDFKFFYDNGSYNVISLISQTQENVSIK